MMMNTIRKNITYATGMVNPKTTALFFDKLWVYPTLVSSGAVPQEVCMDDLTDYNDIYWKASVLNDLGYAYALMGKQSTARDNIREVLKLRNKLENGKKKVVINPEPQGENFFSPEQPESPRLRNMAIGAIVKSYSRVESYSYSRKNIAITPVYFNTSDYDESVEKENSGLTTCFDFLPTALESKLSWKQVIELRKDKKAQEKLTRLRRWFSTDLLGKSKNEIIAILDKKLDDYQWALKKHGIETAIGGMTTVIPVLVSPSVIQMLNANRTEIILSGLALASGSIAWITSKMIARTEIKRDEVAYIYDVQKNSK